ncbi:lipopolysaccharide biosynthesis protein [Streptomyces fimicarius]|uniref:Lipopolysaccharide biosynthesis protein n=1 Tax=Streptomyces caviscabies TaxID=90079 RepID=A0ABW2MMJ7_9ACTN|nr:MULTISPECIES: lipopolysaccharide biosynthesis protein [Streptomyces]MCX4713850.1 lipopolysaccharide biosynthesis protein [Streptomyces griseus]MDX2668149.1 lipopolysaccharide biosynthesis protein [Streptomyces sp. NRRL_ISP-5395]MDX3505793.1 lipopolysaccharide biosynthesis protein [Streptomyces sp. ATCC51928]MDX5522155.1 lipopolysaccharide biosynthesis protein [Streptomyces sp. DE06-01C]QXR00909.1 lipopolysaccharide biosynthesis protein [Streptomyces sp. WY228]
MTESPEQQRPAVARRLRTALTRLPHWWPLPVCVLIGTASGLSYGAFAAPQYEATSYAMAVAEGETDPSAALGYAQSYGRLTTSDATLSYAQGAAGEPVRELRSHVTSETSPDSPMIAVTGTSEDRHKAADIANAVIEAVIVSSGHVSKDTGVKLIKFTHAMTPDRPVSPSMPLGTAVGAAAGGLLGGLVLLVRPRRAGWSVSAQVPGPTAEGGNVAQDERELVR